MGAPAEPRWIAVPGTREGHRMSKVAVMGAGSWGTAFAMMVADAGASPSLWARRPEVAEEIRRDGVNSAYLPDVSLPDGILATADPQEALADAEVVVLAVPSVGIGEQLAAWGGGT